MRFALPPVSSEGFQQFKTYLISCSGLAYYANKEAELWTKLSAHVATLPFEDFQAYLNFLQSSPQGQVEMNTLIEKLTIGETYFFRYKEQFEALKTQILPELLKKNADQKRLRIWSAGCATGEEAYSLAMLLWDTFPRLQHWQVEIIGTDINQSFLQQARQASYREWSFRQTEASLRQSCFLQVDDSWQLLPHYRQWVNFQTYNLIQEDPAENGFDQLPFDLIMCRNVLIYFDQPTFRQLIDKFYRQLNSEGWLILGPAELTPLACKPFSSHALSSLSCFKKSQTKQQLSHEFSEASPEPESSLPLKQPPKTPEANLWLEFQPVFNPLPPRAGPSQQMHPEATGLVKPEAAAIETAPPPFAMADVRRLADLGQLAKAEAALRHQLGHDSLNPELHYYLALIQISQEALLEAQETLQQALYLDRQHILAHYQLGLVKQRQGLHEAARKAFRNATKLLEPLDNETLLADAEDINVGKLKALLKLQQKGLG